QHLQYGPAVDFTYGPLGVFHTAYVPGRLIPLLFLSRSLLAIAFGLACVRLLRGRRPRRGLEECALWFGVIAVSLLAYNGRFEAYWLSFPILMAVLALERDADRKYPSTIVLGLALCSAYVSLVKFTFTVVSIVLSAVVACSDVARRRLPITLGVYVAT